MDEKERKLLIELAKAVLVLDSAPNTLVELQAAYDAVMEDEEPEAAPEHEND